MPLACPVHHLACIVQARVYRVFTFAKYCSNILDVSPPGPNSFNFIQFLGKCWQNRMLAPPGGLAPRLGEMLDPPLKLLYLVGSTSIFLLTISYRTFVIIFQDGPYSVFWCIK